MNNNNTVKFADGQPMKKETEADHLGATITKKQLNKKEVEE